jgi:hypothetical protein
MTSRMFWRFSSGLSPAAGAPGKDNELPEKPLTTVEAAVLFILLAEAGPVSNAVLAREHGCYLKREQRDHLVSLKLVEAERKSGRLVLTLSDKGWAYCRAEIASGSAPARSGAAGGALFAVLRRWDRYLTVRQLSLGDFVNCGSDRPAVVAEQPIGEPEVREHGPQVEERVRTAYEMIAPKAGELVSLADLRDVVGDLIRADVDAALRRLHRRPGVTLVPEANQKTLDRRSRDAAVVIGDQPKHAIAMRVS